MFNKVRGWKRIQLSSSDFVVFLNANFKASEEDVKKLKDETSADLSECTEFYDVKKLKVVGLLQCKGEKEERIKALFETLQPIDQTVMTCNDKDIMTYLKVVFDVATELVFLEMRKDPKLADEVKEITDEKIAEVKKTYDDAITEFIDTVFEYEAKLSKDDWISTVEEKAAWIINSSEIRAKFYPK